MPRRLPGRAIQAGTITVTQLETTVANTVTTGGGPKITAVTVTDASYNNLDDTAVDIAGGYIKITGTGFVTGCQVLINNTPATSTTFVSATEVRAQVPATAAGSYIVYLVNPDGGVAIRINGITFSATPTWVTDSALTGNVDEAISIQLSATLATAYSLQAGSTLPTGLTLSAGGLISGTVTGLTNDTSYSFTVVATDAENQDSPRTFTITITASFNVARSLRFNRLDTAYLSRTVSTSNRRTWTFSIWLKRAQLGLIFNIFNSGSGSLPVDGFYFNTDDTIKYRSYNGSSENVQLITTQVFRDVAAWYHIVLAVDTTDSTAANRIKLYINGSQVTAFSTSTYPAQNFDTGINLSGSHEIGSYAANNTFAGYMAEVNFIDGLALTPISFAKTDATTGQYIPKKYTGTYGTNGFYLNFSDNSATTATTLGKDSSGNNNDWTPNNFSVAAGAGNDSLVDSPTNYGTDTGLGGEVRGNYCTWNPLESNLGTRTLSNGNLDTTNGGDGSTYSNFGMSSGKWYFEATFTYISGSAAAHYIGITATTSAKSSNNAANFIPGLGYCSDGTRGIDGAATSYGATYTTNDIIGVAVDIDAGTVVFYKNGVAQPTISRTLLNQGSGQWIIYTVAGASAASNRWSLNCGQRPFAYTAPSGFKALCTHNLPTPAVVQSNTAFDAVTYTGNNSTQSITGLAFSPDFVWSKCRNVARSHRLTDIVRGSTKELYSDTIAVETNDGSITSFTATGFNLDNATASAYNTSGENYISWCWDAGTATVTNNSGSIASQVRANPAAGFSIVTYTTQPSGTATVGHGLGVAPSFIIVKTRGVADSWRSYHASLGAGYEIFLNQTAAASASTQWNSIAPTSTVFSLGTPNAGSYTTVAYCFAAISGFSSFGSYIGNGSADGPFVYTGFRPKFIVIKRTDATANWRMLDTTRSTANPLNFELYPNLLNSEGTFASLDFLSNGVKLRVNDTNYNASGGTYIYAAFAEQPFKYSRAR